MNPHFKITDITLIHAVLDNAEYGTLAVCENNRPYAVPLNFVRVGKTLYFHGAQKNKKMQVLTNNPYVSFSVVENYALIDSNFSSTEGLACPATQFFKSVSIDGVVEMVEIRAEKAQALEALMRKLQPKGGYKPLSNESYDKALKSTAVYRLVPELVTCKFKFGQHLSKERFEMIVSHLQKRGTDVDLCTVEEMKRQRIGD